LEFGNGAWAQKSRRITLPSLGRSLTISFSVWIQYLSGGQRDRQRRAVKSHGGILSDGILSSGILSITLTYRQCPAVAWV